MTIHKQSRFLFPAAMFAALSTSSCGSPASDKKLDAVLARLDGLDKKMDTMSQRMAGAQPARAPQRPQLDPNTVYAVPVADGDPYVGPKHAKVTIVEAYEYGCPFCKMAADVMDKVVDAHKNEVKVVGKQFVVHPQIATNASLAACAAQKQGKFGPFSSALWKSAWSAEGRLDATKLAPEALESTASQVGLDVGKLKNDMKVCSQQLETNQRELAVLGVQGTPSFFINGRPFVGPRTVEGFGAAIDQEIKRADEALRSGVKLEDYYASIVKNGKRSLD
jgi:protein-disulfide isomerase